MVIRTRRFGELEIEALDMIHVPHGLLGFPHLTKFCLVDPGDDVLILWLQSMEDPDIAFPVLEPKIFRANYTVRLSGAELRELNLENVNQSAVFSVLTIPDDVSAMSANLKAPVVINLKQQVAKQVVLQENEYVVSHPMFKELRTHLMTIAAQRGDVQERKSAPVSVQDIPPSLTVRSLHVN